MPRESGVALRARSAWVVSAPLGLLSFRCRLLRFCEACRISHVVEIVDPPRPSRKPAAVMSLQSATRGMEVLVRVRTADRQIELAPLFLQAIARYQHESTRNDHESAISR
jgi:hypothetical protein